MICGSLRLLNRSQKHGTLLRESLLVLSMLSRSKGKATEHFGDYHHLFLGIRFDQPLNFSIINGLAEEVQSPQVHRNQVRFQFVFC
jgi:hypothetical protein